jgi:hypothetical protein
MLVAIASGAVLGGCWRNLSSGLRLADSTNRYALPTQQAPRAYSRVSRDAIRIAPALGERQLAELGAGCIRVVQQIRRSPWPMEGLTAGPPRSVGPSTSC